MIPTRNHPHLSRLWTVLILIALLLSAGVFAVRAAQPGPIEDEIARLNAVADAQPEDYQNPHPRHDAFLTWPAFGSEEDWTYLIMNGDAGAIAVNGPTSFDNTTTEITADRQLRLGQVFDPDHESEYPDQYNNAALIGFPGYMPTTSKDIIWEFRMRVEPGFYGTTGFLVEPQGTFAPDGTFALPFDGAGITYAGPENIISGLRCVSMIDWMQIDDIPITGVDPFAWNDYEIVFERQDVHSVSVTISVNAVPVCQMAIPNYSQTEVQLWSDNYRITLDPLDPENILIGFNNPADPQGVLFDDISVKAHP